MSNPLPEFSPQKKKKKNSSEKAPAIQWYVMDWLTDVNLRMVSWGARGLWSDLVCKLFISDDRGKFILNGQILTELEICHLSNCPESQFFIYWEELKRWNVVRKDPDGIFYNKRMVNDERIRKIHASFGHLGGNPNLKKVENLVNQNGNQNPTPSSSSSSSYNTLFINKESSDTQEKNEEKPKKKKRETPPEETSPHPLLDWILSELPNVSSMKKQMSRAEADRLLDKWPKADIQEVLESMENKKDLCKNYLSVYFTANNWLKLRQKNAVNNHLSNAPGSGPTRSFTDAIRNW